MDKHYSYQLDHFNSWTTPGSLNPRRVHLVQLGKRNAHGSSKKAALEGLKSVKTIPANLDRWQMHMRGPPSLVVDKARLEQSSALPRHGLAAHVHKDYS